MRAKRSGRMIKNRAADIYLKELDVKPIPCFPGTLIIKISEFPTKLVMIIWKLRKRRVQKRREKEVHRSKCKKKDMGND